MADTVTGLTCPKCHGPMRTYERSSITIDQCTDCRGVFLDRGELERLIDAESGFYADTPRPPAVRSRPGHDEDRPHGDYGSSKRKRGGFLSELFD
jgi:Zn-finger nucleic acid-binding protein